MRHPLLDERYFTRAGCKYHMQVQGGLHYIRGNNAPYFTVSAGIFVKKKNNRWYEYPSGCLHDEIERLFPGKFTDIIALHLSDIDGVPMHAVGNGAYLARGGGQWPWELITDEYRHPLTEDALIERQMRHLRCDRETATNLRKAGKAWVEHERAIFAWHECNARFQVESSFGIGVDPGPAPLQGDWKEYIEHTINAMKPRWKQEAESCIAKHGLVVHGDHWEKQDEKG